MALVAFALCLLIGGLQADNTFDTTVWRALLAMAGTFVVGLVVSAALQRSLDEKVANTAKKTPEIEAKSTVDDR
jgi:uncharacterized membrane protein